MLLKIRQPADKIKVVDYINRLPDSKLYDITVNIHNPKRTVGQNALYWAHMSCIAEYCGNSKEYTHKAMGLKFLPYIDGKLGKEPISTTTLDTKQMVTYMDEIRLWAAEFLGLRLLTPDDLAFDEYCEFYANRK